MTVAIHIRANLHREAFRLHVDETIPGSGITGVFGPSGAGKTTLLRCVAGLERPQGALIEVAGNRWQDSSAKQFVPVHERPFAYVFQEPRLFPHLSVLRNLRYPLKRSGDAAVDFDHVVELLGLGQLLSRSAAGLSGGEAKRVAIARALLRSPQLLLMDEPLAALDPRRRQAFIPYLDRLQAELTMPAIYVSHSIDEITQLCDHLLVMEEGQVVASGALRDVMMRTDIASLGGAEAGVIIATEKLERDDRHDLTRLGFSGGDLWVPSPVHSDRPRLRIRANDVSLCRSRPLDSSILNVLPVVIEEIEQDAPASVLLRLRAGEDLLIARITRRSLSDLGLQRGERVFAQVKSVAVRDPMH